MNNKEIAEKLRKYANMTAAGEELPFGAETVMNQAAYILGNLVREKHISDNENTVMTPYKSYHALMTTPMDELDTEDDKLRKTWCRSIPKSIVASISARISELNTQVMAIEKELDENYDFLDGEVFLDLLREKDGDTH